MRVSGSSTVSMVFFGLLASLLASMTWAGDAVPRIQVVGEGVVAAEPDMAVVRLTVNRKADTAEEALSANNEAMSDVISAMRKQGVDKRDMQTSGFSIQPDYNYPRPTASGERPAPVLTGYTVRNTIRLTVRELENLGAIMDKSVRLGINEGGQLEWGHQNSEEYLEKARIKAVKDAKAKAETLADAADVDLGDLLELSEGRPVHSTAKMADASMTMARSESVPVAAGQVSYQVRVNASYAID